MAQITHPYASKVQSRRSNSSVPPWTSRRPGALIARRPQQPRDINDQQVPGLEDTIRQLFHMTLVSVRGYRELARLIADPQLHACVDVLIQQRVAQCRELARFSRSLQRQLPMLGVDDDSIVDPAAADLQLVWLRTIWTLEQDEFGRFGDNIEQAESILEDAFLTAGNTFHTAGLGTMFRQFAMNICGARQRLEELATNLLSSY